MLSYTLLTSFVKDRISPCDSLALAKEYIQSIDFSMIIQKMIQDGWGKKEAKETEQQYRHFLYLNKKYPRADALPPSLDIDEFWHYHILDTKKYIYDCQNIFGYYLHHYPYLILDKEMNVAELRKAFQFTQELYHTEFGEYIYATRSRYPKILYKFFTLFIK